MDEGIHAFLFNMELRILLVFLCGVIIISIELKGVLATNWGYHGKTGPKFWCSLLPKSMCCGNMQSPVDINTRYATKLRLPELWMRNYDIPLGNVTLSNNGHTVMVHVREKQALPMLTGGVLQGMYLFDNIHFHWGSNANRGSEHTWNGRRYPMEMHIVHINAKYASEELARYHFDGIAVISVLFELTDWDNRDFREIIQGLTKITYKKEEHVMRKSLTLNSLLPKNMRDYVAYFGSETTPPCTQTVTWIVMECISTIGRKQIRAFRNLRRETEENDPDYEKPLVNNYRPLQSPDQRMLFASCP